MNIGEALAESMLKSEKGINLLSDENAIKFLHSPLLSQIGEKFNDKLSLADNVDIYNVLRTLNLNINIEKDENHCHEVEFYREPRRPSSDRILAALISQVLAPVPTAHFAQNEGHKNGPQSNGHGHADGKKHRNEFTQHSFFLSSPCLGRKPATRLA